MPAPPEINFDDFRPLEVKVTGSFEDAIRRFKSIVNNSKILNEVKERQSYEKPSAKRRRQKRESKERQRLLNLKDHSKHDEFDGQI